MEHKELFLVQYAYRAKKKKHVYQRNCGIDKIQTFSCYKWVSQDRCCYGISVGLLPWLVMLRTL